MPRLPQMPLLGTTWKWSPVWPTGSLRRPCGHHASRKQPERAELLGYKSETAAFCRRLCLLLPS